MALIKCKDCGADISDKAIYCPKCGKKVHDIQKKEKTCPECGKILSDDVMCCDNCGYTFKRLSIRKKKIVGIAISAIVVIVLMICIIFFVTREKGNDYVLDACKEIQDDISNPNSLSLKEIYISDEVGENKTINYVYRVYIVYEYTNVYDGKSEKTSLYIVDDKGETYLVDDYSNESQYSYKSLAEMEIYGLEGWFEPSDNWDELTSSEIKKIQNKLH